MQVRQDIQQLLYHHPALYPAAQLPVGLLSLSASGVEKFIPLWNQLGHTVVFVKESPAFPLNPETWRVYFLTSESREKVA